MTTLLKKAQAGYTNNVFFKKIPYYTVFTPTSIPNCQLWMDAADITTMTIASGSISQWNDKSGNGYSFLNNATLTPWNFGSAYFNQDIPILYDTSGNSIPVSSLYQ